VAVASAGPYASHLHLTTDNHARTSSLRFFKSRMLFLQPNQQHQSTVLNYIKYISNLQCSCNPVTSLYIPYMSFSVVAMLDEEKEWQSVCKTTSNHHIQRSLLWYQGQPVVTTANKARQPVPHHRTLTQRNHTILVGVCVRKQHNQMFTQRTQTHTTISRPFIWDYTGASVPEETLTFPAHQPFFINFLHLPRSTASSLLNLRA